MRRRFAIHEAGHAVAAAVLGWCLVEVSIKRQVGKSRGYCMVFPPVGVSSQIIARDAITIAFAGRQAEDAILPPPDDDEYGHYSDDDSRAEELVEKYHLHRIENHLREKALDLACRHYSEIEAVANELLKRRTLSGEEVKMIMRGNP